MKLPFQVLLLVVMFALQKSQEYEDEPEYYSVDTDKAVFDITMYQQMEDREKNRLIVVCMFDRMFEWEFSRWIKPFELSVQSELNYTKDKVDCNSVDLDHHEEGVSLFCKGLSPTIAVGLFIMTVAVIVT
ncbi:hypothetical protein F2P79_000826 [Pimephales promelas]|nr:hypothetical protein F2P79_000826 [Pimephales promelas]